MLFRSKKRERRIAKKRKQYVLMLSAFCHCSLEIFKPCGFFATIFLIHYFPRIKTMLLRALLETDICTIAKRNVGSWNCVEKVWAQNCTDLGGAKKRAMDAFMEAQNERGNIQKIFL